MPPTAPDRFPKALARDSPEKPPLALQNCIYFACSYVSPEQNEYKLHKSHGEGQVHLGTPPGGYPLRPTPAAPFTS